MITNGEDTIDEDKGLLHVEHEICLDSELTLLTEMVRKHYLKYLERQLHENLLNSNYINKKNGICVDNYEEVWEKSIKKTALLLEDRAVKACMITKFYQRAMVKIIAIVRRTTDEKKLLTHLEKCIQTKDKIKPETFSKETQTEDLNSEEPCGYNEHISSIKSANHENVMSLDEKIELFKKHLQKEKCIMNITNKPANNNKKICLKKEKHDYERNRCRIACRYPDENHLKYKEEAFFSPMSVVTRPTTPTSPDPKPLSTMESSCIECTESNILVENENSNDSIAVELARLFSEEKTELDEIFGIDPNEGPDDPQICKILKEIEEAKIMDSHNFDHITNRTKQTKIGNPRLEPFRESKISPQKEFTTSVDLSKSIWPCELFGQRRKLSESLGRLIEEDLRWHDIIKWRFSELFGDDSDDEFTPCSPSIELNDVLIGSGIRRISPWVVQYLMKPMKHGLIGNRFLFKKLAKNIARSIIMMNPYPDESVIEDFIENFFCLHQAVMSAKDLEFNIPSISSYF